MTPDASNRSYYRLRVESETWVLMVLADPDPHRPAEEIGRQEKLDELPFLNVARFLDALGWPVPRVHAYDRSLGWILLEDLGAETLFDRLVAGKLDGERALEYYSKAVDRLGELQRGAEHPEFGRCLIAGRRYDAALLDWEFDHYVEWALVKGPHSPNDRTAIDRLSAALHALTPILRRFPDVPTHRDYHSKNLMISTLGRIGIIDFQDALMGPPTYDLASLLGDAYWELTEDSCRRLVDRFHQATEGRYPKAEFQDALDATIVQRQLKAVGRFYYLDRVKGKSGYLPFIPSLLRRLRDRTRRGPFAELGRCMEAAGCWRTLSAAG